MRDSLRVILLRDLHALDREVALYPDDESLWLTPPGITNSGGTLAQHLSGNLRHFIGTAFGKTGFVRDRDSEFGTKGRTREDVRADIQRTISEVGATLDAMSDEDLAGAFPIRLRERSVRAADFLTHLAAHLGYHLGQIDYHRRMLTPDAKPANALSIEEIPAIEP
jgi:hypothetical protein